MYFCHLLKQLFMFTGNLFANYSNRRFLALSILSGILLSLSWPERGFPFIIFFAFIPLLIIEESILRNKKEVSSIRFLLFSWLTFIIWNGLTTYWIVFSTLPGVLLAVFFNSLFMTMPLFITHLVRRKTQIQISLLPFIALWISFEYLHMNWELSWSWLNLGNAFARYPQWIQWYEYTGALGGTLWILIMNLLFFSIIKIISGHHFKKRFKNFVITATISFFIIPSAISFVKYYTYQEEYDPVEILMIQPNFDPYDRARTKKEIAERIDLMINLADKHLTPETEFIIFPEGVLPESVNKNQLEKHVSINRINNFISDYDSLYLVSGVMAYELYGPNPDASPTARKIKGSSNYYDVFNAALMVDKNADYQFYSKSRLVPGVERMPYYRLFRPLKDLITKFGGIPGSMATWENQKPFHTKDSTKVFVLVCYESIYGEYINKFILQNSELIIIITNDGWWRDTPGYRQHNQYARLRAVETRRSVARAANTGISSFINQRGDIVEASSWDELTFLRNSLNKNQKATFYVVHGDFLGRFASFIVILMILYVIVQYFLSKRKNYLS